jgi:hypothetical protein
MQLKGHYSRDLAEEISERSDEPSYYTKEAEFLHYLNDYQLLRGHYLIVVVIQCITSRHNFSIVSLLVS